MLILNDIDKFLDEFDSLTSKPENFLSVQNDLENPVKNLTKHIYDFTKQEEKKLSSANALPELIVDRFDTEQVWQEIELQNEDRWTHTLSNVSKFLSGKIDLSIPVDFSQMGNDESDEQMCDDDLQEENEEKSDDDNEKSEDDEDEADEEEEEEEEEFEHVKKSKSKSKKKEKGSIVDDRFFKLSEMEAFLDAEDKKEMLKDKKRTSKGGGNKHNEVDDDDDEDIDLFDDMDSDDEPEFSGKSLKYSDFFDEKSDSSSDAEESNVQSKRKSINNENRKVKKRKVDDEAINEEDELNSEDDMNESNDKLKKVRFDLPQPSSDDDDDDDNSEDVDETNDNKDASKEGDLSEFQLRQQRLNKKIGHLENNLLQEKSWTMRGEVDASSRPQNSLLEEVVDFDMISRPAPVITEETTLKLQDIIIRRIKDKAWDDVERKAKPAQEVNEFKKELVLDQEKSKLSLAQIYEQEFIKQREALDPDADEKPVEEPKEHVEIRQLMSSLFAKLDALGDFHYTPKVAVPEVKIISNVPAITMEEVTPVATSDATLLAPQEIKSKAKGDIIGKSERTVTDRKRERRQKKLKQREKEKDKLKREKLIDKMRPGLGNKYSKEKMNRMLKEVTKDRNVTKMDEMNDKKSLTSSSAFFEQLQDEVSNTVKSKLKTIHKKEKKSYSAKQLKL